MRFGRLVLINPFSVHPLSAPAPYGKKEADDNPSCNLQGPHSAHSHLATRQRDFEQWNHVMVYFLSLFLAVTMPTSNGIFSASTLACSVDPERMDLVYCHHKKKLKIYCSESKKLKMAKAVAYHFCPQGLGWIWPSFFDPQPPSISFN